MKVSRAFFGLVILAFLLPFFVVTCNGTKIASYSGFQLVTGSEGSDPNQGLEQSIKGLKNIFDDDSETRESLSDKSSSKSTRPSIPAILVLVTAIAGLICAFSLKPDQHKILMIIAILGIVLLIILAISAKTKVSKAEEESEGLITLAINLKSGYYLALLGFILVVAASYMQKKKPAPANVPEFAADAGYRKPEPEAMPEIEEAKEIPPEGAEPPS